MMEPAPMFAARNVEKIRPAPSFRSATKKLRLSRTRRETHRANSTSAPE